MALPQLPRFHESTAVVEAARGVPTTANPAVAELRQLAEEVLRSMRAITSVALGDRIQTETEVTEGQSGDERSKYFGELNAALEAVRASLRQYEGAEFDYFVDGLRTHVPDLFGAVQRARAEYIAYTREVERVA